MSARLGRVLVLDDDPAVGATIGLVAEAAGFDVDVTARFEDFWATLAVEAPTHVTLDLNMPEVDGIEVLRRLAEFGFDGSVVITSGLERRVVEAARRSAIEHGLHFAGVLSKPFAASELQALLLAPRERRVVRSGVPRRPLVDAATLRAALDQRRLRVAYQPKVACGDGRVVGYEALARWHHPGLGQVPPDLFIGVAEQEDLIGELTDQVFGAGLAWLRHFDPDGETHLALNLSARSLGDVGLTERIERACHAHAIPLGRVVLELTETASTGDQTTALDVLTRLRIKGLALSIDDFGTGHSTLVQLAHQPFSELKIDRQFVTSSARSSESRTIVRAMVSLAHGLGLQVTAEGVEDAETYAWLAELGCDRAQGFFIGRPMPGEDVVGWSVAWLDRLAAGRVGGGGPVGGTGSIGGTG